MHPSSIISYYPTYSLLDEIMSHKNSKKLNIFVDLKNAMQTLYMEHAVINLVESSLKARFIDTSIFSSLISFMSFHKIYGIKRNIDINFYIFFETGQSYFHTNIEKRYKSSRKQDDLYGLDREKRELFFEVIQKNLMLIEKAVNKIPKAKVIRLQNLEADFIPYYLMRNKMVDMDGVMNVTYSNDHDMFQNVTDNSFIYSKHYKSKKIIKPGEIVKHFTKQETNIPDEYYPLMMAVVGDPGDDVIGINGIGGKRITLIIDELIHMVGGMDQLNNNVFNGDPIFINSPNEPNKYIDKILEAEEGNQTISKNLKLVSYEMLSRIVDDPPNTEILKKRKHIEEVITNDNKTDYKSLFTALSSVGVMLEGDALENLFYKVQTL